MIATRLPLLAAATLAIATPAGSAGAAESAPSQSGSAEDAASLHLIEMPRLIVPIVEGNRAVGRLRMTMVLRAADAAGAARITGELPMLREAGVAAASEFARLYASPFVPVDAHRLADELTAGLRAHDPAVATVLLVEVVADRV